MPPGSASASSAPFKATWTRPRCSRLQPCATHRSETCWSKRGVGRATSSTSATGCCPKRTSRPSVPSWTSCMAREQIAVLMMAYGGPGKLDDVEPYLLDVRGGRATTPQLVAEFSTRYAPNGRPSPILQLTPAPAPGVAPAAGDGSAALFGL